jgi:hypothetical protein
VATLAGFKHGSSRRIQRFQVLWGGFDRPGYVLRKLFHLSIEIFAVCPEITGRANYRRLSTALGLGSLLEDDPDQALRPEVAYGIMSVGMRKGMFTGKKLGDYINADACDYRNARRIINGTDQWERIQGFAVSLEDVLRTAVSA